MKVLVLFLVIGTHALYATAHQPFYWTRSGLNLSALLNSMERKCTDTNNKNHCKAANENFRQCLSSLGAFPTEPVEDYQNFCKYLRGKQFGKCLKNVVIDLSPILAKTEMYLQHLLLNAFNSGLEEFCGVDGFSNTNYFVDTFNQTRDCIVITVYLSLANGTCISPDLNVFKNLDQGALNLNKESVCLDLDSLHKCSAQVLTRECEVDFSRFTDLIFRPFLEECNTLSKEEGNFELKI